MMNELELVEQRLIKYVYKLVLRGGVTVIGGESGVGKSLLYKALNKRNDTLCFNHTIYKIREDLPDLIAKHAGNNTIVVIDNTEDLMTDALDTYIMQNNNRIQFILFARKRYACVQTADWMCDLVRKQCTDGSIVFWLDYKRKDIGDLNFERSIAQM